MHRSAAKGHKDTCNLLLNTKSINVNVVDKVMYIYMSMCVVIVCYFVSFNKIIKDVLMLLIFTGTWLTTKRYTGKLAMKYGVTTHRMFHLSHSVVGIPRKQYFSS